MSTRIPDGLWRSRGYGWILAADAQGYVLHHESALNCIAAERGSHEDFARSYDRIRVDGDTLSLHQAGDLTRYTFGRIERMPAIPVLEPGGSADALLNFDTLWHTFDAHYAFFDLHDVDWRAARERHRARLSTRTAPEPLFTELGEMLEPLDDGHVTLAGAGRVHQRVRAVELRAAMRSTLGLPNGRVTPRTTVDAIHARREDLFLAPFASTRGALRVAGNGILAWCELKPGIGYVSVLRLFGFADTAAARAADDLPHTRAAVAEFLRDDLRALDVMLDAMCRDLAGCRAVIVDLRLNGGGFDRAGLALAARFADRGRHVLSKCARDGKGFTPAQEFFIEPAATTLTAPVLVLTSPLCVSAGEICALGFRALPHATLMGLPTAGMLSDNLNKPLPNGWELSLSNEIYRSPDDEMFEGTGVPPTLEWPTLEATRFVEALQQSLLAAVDLCERAPAGARANGASA